MSGPINITYTSGSPSAEHTETFDFLIVACDPRLVPFEQRSKLEERVHQSLSSYTFHTSLINAKRPDVPQIPIGGGSPVDAPNYGIRFNPKPLSDMNYEMYAYRDEVYTRENHPSSNNTTWATCYQISKDSLYGLNEEQKAEVLARFNENREATLANRTNWCDLEYSTESGGSPSESILVDYFQHFSSSDLEDLLPWAIRHEQGKNNTMYVASFASFESVLHCYLYQRKLMLPDSSCYQNYFPKDQNARIAVIGAGPSGILFAAEQLCEKGYTNFKIFEKDTRYGGKTYTYNMENPTNQTETVPCELGTCYLSLGYFPMFHLFRKYGAGEVRGLSGTIRSVIDPDLAVDNQERQSGIEFDEWIFRMNGAEPNTFDLKVMLEFGVAILHYCLLHKCIMQMSSYDAIPPTPPDESSAKRVLDKVAREVHKRRNEKDTEDGLDVKTSFEVLTDMEPSENSSIFKRVLRFMMIGMNRKVSYEKILSATKDVFNKTFREFLEANNMARLIPALIYGYQVQGYGKINEIPAYYGMIWITPVVMASFVLDGLGIMLPNGMSTTNLASKGWLKLWENMVESRLSNGCLQLGTTITSVSRVMTDAP